MDAPSRQCYFASYWSSERKAAPVLPAAAINPILASLSSDGTISPAKRPRPDSPDVSITSSSPPPELGGFFPQAHRSTAGPLTEHFMSEETSSSTLLPRSILSSISSPLSSPPTSRPLSRRSSTGASKSVRFARCTNASVYATHSIEEYDRSPIVPTCAADSLELPRRDSSEEEGWIKCVERARAAAARAVVGCSKNLIPGAAKAPLVTGVASPVEGLHGLIEGRSGGYFVGEERDQQDLSSSSTVALDAEPDIEIESDDMLVDDGDQRDVEDDDDDDDDEDGADAEEIFGARPTGDKDVEFVDDDSGASDGTPSSVGSSEPTFPLSSADEEMADPLPLRTKDALTLDSPPPPPGDVSPDESGRSSRESSVERTDDAHAAGPKAGGKAKKCKDRYGICALGKYTRADVFQSYDSLGGF